MATSTDLPHRPGKIREIKTTIAYDDSAFVANASSATVNVGGAALPDNACVLGAFVDVDTAWTAGGGLTGLTVQLGDSADANAILDAIELVSGSPAAGNYGKKGTRAAGADGNAQLRATFTATGANLGDGSVTRLTAGALDVYVIYTTPDA